MGSEVRSRPHLVMCRAAGLALLSDGLGLCAAVERVWSFSAFRFCGVVFRCVVGCVFYACGVGVVG